MKKCGKLKTLPDLKDFWEQMLSPLQSPAYKYQDNLFPPTSIWTVREEEEDETNSWAITASQNVS